jgi:hypothetical protein
MKILSSAILLLSTFNLSAEIITSKFCENFYKTSFSKKTFKLHTVYESKTLCAFEMDNNTISFNMKSVAPGQNLSAKDVNALSYKGKWINIFSKDQATDVTEQNLSDLGIPGKDSCISALPVKNSVQCPLKDKNAFEIIAKSKSEDFIKKEF